MKVGDTMPETEDQTKIQAHKKDGSPYHIHFDTGYQKNFITGKITGIHNDMFEVSHGVNMWWKMSDFPELDFKTNTLDLKVGDELPEFEGTLQKYYREGDTGFEWSYENLKKDNIKIVKLEGNRIYVGKDNYFELSDLQEKLKNKPNMEKKIIGYKFKSQTENYRKAVEALLKLNYSLDTLRTFDSNFEKYGFHFEPVTGHTPGFETYLKNAGVLDLWFEPVYEEETFKAGDWIVKQWNKIDGGEIDIFKIDSIELNGYNFVPNTYYRNDEYLESNISSIQEKKDPRYSYRKPTKEEIRKVEKLIEDRKKELIISIGSNDTYVTVRKNGDIILKHSTTNIESVKALKQKFTEIEGATIGRHKVKFVSYSARFLRIGCSAEDHRVSINDLQAVIDTYNKLNK